jgi:hypothetical protein
LREENIYLKKQNIEYVNDHVTNNRKTYYDSQYYSDLSFWSTIFNVIYFIVVFILIIFMFLKEEKISLTIGIKLLLLFVFYFFLPRIVEVGVLILLFLLRKIGSLIPKYTKYQFVNEKMQ